MHSAEAPAIAVIGAAFQNRMADKAAGQPDPLEIGWFERKQSHQMIVPTRHSPGPPGSPCPDHRGDVMNQRHGLAAATQPVRHPPTKPRAVDRHDGVRTQFADRGYGLADTAQDYRGARQDFCHSHDSQIAERDEAIEALLSHALAADPGDPQPAAGALLQRRNQRAAEGVPRWLSGNNENERRFVRGHDQPTPTRNSLARSAARITSSRSSTIVALASTAIPCSPVSAASRTVRNPIVGRSARGS